MRESVVLALFLSAVISSGLLSAKAALKSGVTATAAKTPAMKIASKLPHQLIYPGDEFYPQTWAKKGVQGEVLLEINLSKEGKASVARLIGGSKSSELDQNALNYVNTGYYKLPDNGLKYFEGRYSLIIIFLKDSVLSINAKTCGDLNTDLAYFRSLQSGENVKNLGAFELVANIFTVQLMKDQGASDTLKFVKAVDSINQDTISACAKKPTDLFIKTYVSASKKRGIKF